MTISNVRERYLKYILFFNLKTSQLTLPFGIGDDQLLGERGALIFEVYLCSGVGAGTPKVEEVVGGVEVEAEPSVQHDGGVLGFSCISSLHAIPAIVHIPSVVERFKV